MRNRFVPRLEIEMRVSQQNQHDNYLRLWSESKLVFTIPWFHWQIEFYISLFDYKIFTLIIKCIEHALAHPGNLFLIHCVREYRYRSKRINRLIIWRNADVSQGKIKAWVLLLSDNTARKRSRFEIYNLDSSFCCWLLDSL